ncbi:MAG: protease-4 [Cycloclasticus pugetii]|jgi:protease-4|uniref:Peptidase S49 n=1 Tax=Cycloclasticus zancles 78-ME TaxID=1198232 RepID=S5T7L7_9GAMM|nr:MULTISPECIES: S49 family peptidase [Cycloclasticus]AFT67214.1 protease transmembrane protein [Cycloclasticus sp. P1]AGS39579.1 Peptidase S49 [Cycloclasticus zancles 78-ME]MBV1899867.1 S49 family peptidase [Cycloclasticus sp.]MDF1829557.1 S49 family peptidase [Cycloclasticus pugetii]SHJ44112.1 protease-4 [Cycloclasticus pugetii]|tara:strand:+ start:4091 stop:5062 length:972 start_codon:yes stop_codon:yes gene_type:complete
MAFFNKDKSIPNDQQWERSVLEKVALASVIEQRRTRRWNIFFKLLLLTYIIFISSLAMSPMSDVSTLSKGPHTAMVDVKGIIVSGGEADAESIIKSLKNAVKDPNTKGIVLRVNSPGGSPVQSSYVYEAIRELKNTHPTLPIYAVVEDLCASGCYFIASAADKIFVNQSSIVGSIGVVMNGFGFTDTMKSLGVERRLYTAGEHKGFLDPFSNVKPAEKAHVQGMLNDIHTEFIESVKSGRGERLAENPDLFSGLVWAGSESIELGLTDAIGDVRSVAKNEIGEEKIVDFTAQQPFLEKLAKSMGAATASFMANFTTLNKVFLF